MVGLYLYLPGNWEFSDSAMWQNYSLSCYQSEKVMAPHSSTLAWNMPWTESLVGCSPWGCRDQTLLSDFTFTFRCHALGKEMATHSSVLAWRVPGTGEPDGLPSLGSHRVGHEWSDLAAAALANSYSSFLLLHIFRSLIINSQVSILLWKTMNTGACTGFQKQQKMLRLHSPILSILLSLNQKSTLIWVFPLNS